MIAHINIERDMKGFWPLLNPWTSSMKYSKLKYFLWILLLQVFNRFYDFSVTLIARCCRDICAKCFLSAIWLLHDQIFGHYQGSSLTNAMLIICFYVNCRPEGHQELRNEVASLSPAKHLEGFKQRTFRFLHNILTH